MFRNQWGLWLALVSCLSCLSLMQLQDSPNTEGFISIDCGKQEGYRYSDEITGLSYSSDEGYISTGEIHNVSPAFYSPHGEQARDLRSFPDGTRNCYSMAVNHSKFLVRAWFLYGNYDGLNSPPRFALYLGATFWSNVNATSSFWQYYEAITLVEPGRNLSVCLVNQSSGVPFISALEVRPLNKSIYEQIDGTSRIFVKFARFDLNDGQSIGRVVRFPDDRFDRIWESHGNNNWSSLSTKDTIIENDGYAVPNEVLRTAVYPKPGSQLSFCWGEVKNQFFAYIYIVELQRNETRQFKIRFEPKEKSDVPVKYNEVTLVTWPEPTVPIDKLEIVFTPNSSTTLQPIASAFEVYTAMNVTKQTDWQDVVAINDVKIALNVKKDDWAGDPCAPEDFMWSGLKCGSPEGSEHPKITALNLSSSGLTGEIPNSFKNLSSLESLDLSNNDLRGRIPEFLGNLPLKFLDLSNNRFKGTIPESLRKKSFNFSFENNPDLCKTADWRSCKRNSIWLTVVIISCVVAMLVIALIILLVHRQKKRKQGEVGYAVQRIKRGNDTETSGTSQYTMDFPHESRQFIFVELLQITNNFNKVIGEGGFGRVYHGLLENGMEVAVKRLSHSSSQGHKEFLKEAQLLSRIHHRNLVSLVGYCDDGQHLALVYEYMSNGSLKDHLSGKTSQTELSSWRERLRIATEVCQGLEYLHKGCKPSIIHRDVKTSNILLNYNMEAKLADFGLSKICPNDSIVGRHSHVSTSIVGTPGYLDPEYSSTYQLTEKSDIYSFGIVLFELVTGLDAIIREKEHIHIVQLVEPILHEGGISNVVDTKLQGGYDINSIWKAVEIALSCTHAQSIHRPSSSEVLIQLKDCLELEDQGKTSSINTNISNNSMLDMPDLHDSLIGYPMAR